MDPTESCFAKIGSYERSVFDKQNRGWSLVGILGITGWCFNHQSEKDAQVKLDHFPKWG